MTFEGPSQSDFANIAALNREFLRLVRSSPGSFGFDDERRKRLLALGRRQLEWLAAVPFLLFSLYEDDADRWRAIFADEPCGDLFSGNGGGPNNLRELAAAAAGFLWQLSRQNPHAVRMVCGADNRWCEALSELTYFTLLARIRAERQPLTVRHLDDADLWTRLLGPAVSTESEIRAAAQIAALQAFLASQQEGTASTWRSAACSTRAPSLGVAELGDEN